MIHMLNIVILDNLSDEAFLGRCQIQSPSFLSFLLCFLLPSFQPYLLPLFILFFFTTCDEYQQDGYPRQWFLGGASKPAESKSFENVFEKLTFFASFQTSSTRGSRLGPGQDSKCEFLNTVRWKSCKWVSLQWKEKGKTRAFTTVTPWLNLQCAEYEKSILFSA